MSYLAPYLDESGIHLPTYSERLDNLLTGYKRIFGDDVYLGEDTMDYQLLSLVAKCWDDLNSLILDNYNARNPNYATGTALDLLLPLNGLVRMAATKSSVTLLLTGIAGMTLPAGMQAMDGDGHVWEIEDAIEFPASASTTSVVSVTAYCTEFGAISAAAGTITTMNTPDPYWLSVTNPADAVLGREIETDAELRKRRSLSVSLPSRSILSGIRAALLNLEGVTSVNILENDTGEDGEIPAHSIACVVEGGTSAEIAETIWRKKCPGTGLDGDQIVTYTDEYQQDNTIKFYRPVNVGVLVTIELRVFASYDESLLREQIPAAVTEHVNSLGIGEDLIVGLLNAVIYNANQAGYPIFSITSLQAQINGQSGTATSDALSATFKTMFRNNGNVTVTDISSGQTEAYRIEVG